MEVTPQMRPAGGFPELMAAIGTLFIEFVEPGIGVRLQDAAAALQMLPDMFALPVGGKVLDGPRRGGSGPWPLIADIGPNPALFHTFAQAFVPARAIQNPDWRVVTVKQVTGHDLGLDPLSQRLQNLHGTTAPAHQRAVGNVSPHTGEDFVQAIERKMIVELRDQHVGQKTGARHAARDRTAGRGHLHHLFTAPTRFLHPCDLDDLELRRDHVEQFTDVFTHNAQITTATGAVLARIKLTPLARGAIRDAGTATGFGLPPFGRRLNLGFVILVIKGGVGLGNSNQQILQRQFQLFDLALDLFRSLAKHLFGQFGDPQPQGLNQLIMGA